ncbi:hypothetical protein ACXM0N_20110 [Peribacillus simplex]
MESKTFKVYENKSCSQATDFITRTSDKEKIIDKKNHSTLNGFFKTLFSKA